MKENDHPAEHHLFRRLGKDILFNVSTMLFYEVTPVVVDLMSHMSTYPQEDAVQSLKSRYSKGELKNARNHLKSEGFLLTSQSRHKKPLLKKRYGIRHLELMVTHGCNMGCRYCYGAHGGSHFKDTPYLYGSQSGGMTLGTAKAGVDFLFHASGGQKKISIVFFGGEPLLEFDLIQKIVPYIRKKEAESDKEVRLSMSTNGLLMNEQIVAFLNKNKISCQISIDGPKDIQDRNRCLKNGEGSYDLVMKGVQKLIQKRPGRVPARVTLAGGIIEIPRVVEHLLSLGFGSIHVEPDNGLFPETSITPEDLEKIKAQNETMARLLVKHVRQNRYFNYANLVKHIRQSRVVRERQAHFCGAGRTYFALSQDGDFYPCHRFVGMRDFRMGDLKNGFDRSLQRKILDLTVDNRPVCSTCWARYLCGGGCWKHNVDKNGRLELPDETVSCRLIRHAIECAMAVNSELNVSDKDILSDIYEDVTEPHLLTKNS